MYTVINRSAKTRILTNQADIAKEAPGTTIIGDIRNLPLSGLVKLYNSLTDKPVKKFSTKPIALARVQTMLESYSLVEKETLSTPVKTKGGRPGKITKDAVITLLVASNPKRIGTASYERFELYRNEMTVQEFLTTGGRRADLEWDVARKFIRIS